MRTLIAVLGLLICVSAEGSRPNYFSSRRWVEERCVTNQIPQERRIFVGHILDPKYAAIICFRRGIRLREIIDQTPLKGKVVRVLVSRADSPFSEHYIRIGPLEKPGYKIKPLDMIWLYEDVLLPSL